MQYDYAAVGKENAPTLRNQILAFSPQKLPVKKSGKNQLWEDDASSHTVPVLLCAPFQSTLWMGFGCVALNSTLTKVFELRNETEKVSNVIIEQWEATSPAKVGFTVSFGASKLQAISIPPKESCIGYVTWTPTCDQSVSENAILKLNDKLSLQITLHGIAGTGDVSPITQKKDVGKKEKPRKRSLSSESRGRKPLADKEPNKRSSSLETNQDKEKQAKTVRDVISSKKNKGAINSNFISLKKVMCDNSWVDKQIAGFTEWLNYTFRKNALSEPADANDNKGEISAITADRASGIITMQYIAQKRLEAKIRQSAMEKFRELAGSLVCVEHEVSEGRIALRDDRELLADVGLQEIFLKLLFSYEICWLRLGLEVVFGEILALPPHLKKNEVDQWKKLLKTFIMERFIDDPEIVSKKKTFTYHGAEDQTRVELKKHILKKILSLVLLLDCARQSQLISMPTLFTKSAAVKSSKDFLSVFCKEFLKGEGDLVRHLSTMQYNVTFIQTYVDEFDYNVTNLAVDLRDGVRLARLIELLSCKFNLSASLRVPAGSRLQKLHNVGISIKYLKDEGIDSTTSTKAIVDGDRDKTLVFLWRIMFHFDLKQLIDFNQIRAEVEAIQVNFGWRRSVYRPEEVSDFAVSVPKADRKSTSACAEGKCENQTDELISALINWCHVITEQYEVPVFNMTSCLADGRALCLLIHYYHPTLLPLKDIKKTSMNFYNPLATMSRLDYFTETNVIVSKAEMQNAINNERKNFTTLRRACLDIGGIPMLLPVYDTKNLPEEKTVIVFLGHLFSRLVETSSEVRAAIRIQRYSRNVYLKKIAAINEKKNIIKAAAKRAAVQVKIASQVSNKFVSEVPVTVNISILTAASIIARRIVSFMTRCRFLSYLAGKKSTECIDQELAHVREDNFVVRISRYGVPKSSFSAFPLSRTEQSERLSPYTPSTPAYSESDSYCHYQSSEREKKERSSDHFAESFNRSDLRSDFVDEKAVLLIESVKADFEAEARASREVLIKEMEAKALHDIEIARAEAQQLAEENASKLYEQIKFSEVQMAERERSVKLDAEIALLKAEEIRHLAELEAQKLAYEISSVAEHKVQAEKEARANVEAKYLVEAEARQIAETKLREIEEKAIAEQQTRLMLEAKLKEIEDIQVAKENERIRQLEESQRKQVVQNLATVVLQRYWRGISATKLCASLKANKLAHALAEQKAIMEKVLLEEKVALEKEEFERKELISIALKKRRIDCSIKIQKLYRGVCGRKVASVKREHVQQLAMEAAKQAFEAQQEAMLLADAEAAISLQITQVKEFKLAMRSSSSNKICRWFRALRPLLRARIMIRGFQRMQAVFRGNKIRMLRPVVLSSVYQKLQLATVAANANPTLQLGKQTTEALRILKTGRIISHLFKACHTLELSTRLSKNCCQAFAEASASKILFSLIQSCNRSAPHQELLRYALVILLHVARHDVLAPIVAKADNATDVVIHLMQMFRDKGQIFCLSCELLCRLVEASQDTKDLCNSINSRKCLDGILHIIETKHRLTARVQTMVSRKSMLSNACTSPKGKAKYLASEEPVNCIRHLMYLLDQSP